MRKIATLTGALFALAACGGGETTSSADPEAGDGAAANLIEAPAPPEIEPSLPTSPEQQAAANAVVNLEALAAYRDHAEQFKIDHGSYPATKRSFRSALGAFEDAAEAVAEDGAEVNLNLPEGTMMRQPGRIVYRSDGTDYKVIAQRTGDCSVVRATDPDLIDPKRDYGPGDCIAYGYWTSGAESW